MGIGPQLQFPHLPRTGPVLLKLLFFPLVPSSYWVLHGSIYSFPLVRSSCLLSAAVLHALLCLKVFSWCICGERCTPSPPTSLPSCSPSKLSVLYWVYLCPWGFSRQEYCSGLLCPPPGDLPKPGIAVVFITIWATREAQKYWSVWPIPSPGDLPKPGIKPRSPTLQVASLPSELLGKPRNTGVCSLSLLQGIFPTQESNQGLLRCRWILYQLIYQGSPTMNILVHVFLSSFFSSFLPSSSSFIFVFLLFELFVLYLGIAS